MRTSFLALTLLLSTIASSAFAQEHFITSPLLKATMVGANQQPPTYQMLCRGGNPGLHFTTTNTGVGPNREQIVTYEIGFTPSRQAAGPRGIGLEPGQCSWIDRPVNEKEPYLIRFDTPLHFTSGRPTDNSPTAAERFPDAYTIPEYMKDKNHYWSFVVYNNIREGYFQSTANKYFNTININDKIRRPPDDTGSKVRRRVVIPGKP